MSSSPQSYRVTEPLRAVRFTQETGKKGTIVLIPQGATIQVRGPGLSAGLLNIEWQNELYSVLREDLQSRGTQI